MLPLHVQEHQQQEQRMLHWHRYAAGMPTCFTYQDIPTPAALHTNGNIQRTALRGRLYRAPTMIQLLYIRNRIYTTGANSLDFRRDYLLIQQERM